MMSSSRAECISKLYIRFDHLYQPMTQQCFLLDDLDVVILINSTLAIKLVPGSFYVLCFKCKIGRSLRDPDFVEYHTINLSFIRLIDKFIV